MNAFPKSGVQALGIETAEQGRSRAFPSIKRQIEVALASLVPIVKQIAKFMFSDAFLRLHVLSQNWMGPTAPNHLRTFVGSSSSM